MYIILAFIDKTMENIFTILGQKLKFYNNYKLKEIFFSIKNNK